MGGNVGGLESLVAKSSGWTKNKINLKVGFATWVPSPQTKKGCISGATPTLGLFPRPRGEGETQQQARILRQKGHAPLEFWGSQGAMFTGHKTSNTWTLNEEDILK